MGGGVRVGLEPGAERGQASVSRPYRSLYRWMALTDSGCVLAGLLIAYQYRFGTLWPSTDFWVVLGLAPFVTVAFALGFGLYRVHQCSSLEEFRRILLAISMTITSIAMLSYWSKVSYSRLWIGVACLLCLLFAVISRRLWHREIRRGWVEGRLGFETLIVGTNDEAEHLAHLLTGGKLGFRPLGFVATSARSGASALPVLGRIGELRELIHRTGANCVFVAATAVQAADVKHVLKARRLDGVEIRVTANVPATLSTTRVTPQSVGGLMALSVNAVRLTRGQAIAKRVFDVVLSTAGLLLIWPLLLAVAIAVKLDDGGPVLFRQQRVGLQRRPFTLLKFRTMVPRAELLLADLLGRNEADGPLFKVREDPRVTRVGRWLRRLLTSAVAVQRLLPRLGKPLKAGQLRGQPVGLQAGEHLVRRLVDGLVLGVQDHLGLQRRLVGVGDAGEVGDHPGQRLGVQTLHVTLGAGRDRRGHVHLHEVAHRGAHPVARLPVRRDGGDHHHHAVLGELARDVADAGDVGVPVLVAEAQLLAEVGTDLVAVEHLDAVPALEQTGRERAGDRGLARAGQPGQPQDEAGVVVHADESLPGRGSLGRGDRLGQLACCWYASIRMRATSGRLNSGGGSSPPAR